MISRQYVTYNAIDLDYFTHNWATIDYNTILIKTWPADDIDISDTTSGASAIRFLYPLKQTAVFVDGLAECRVTFYNSDAGVAKTINSYTVKLRKVDSSNIFSDLGSHTESGLSVSVASEAYQSFLCEIEVTKKELKTNEKLVLEVSLTGDTAQIQHAHGYDSTNSLVDTWIKVPYIGGGS